METLELFPKQRVSLEDFSLDIAKIVPPDMSEYPAKAFIESVNRLGVLDPIIVEETEDGYEIIEGRRRYWAARESGMTEIPAKVKRDDTNAHMLALTGNYARSNNPYDEYLHLRSLLDTGHTLDGIAKTTNINKRRAQKLLNTGDRLAECWKTALGDDAITWGAAEVLATLSIARQEAAYADDRNGSKFTKGDALALKTAAAQQAAAPEMPAELFSVPEDPAIAKTRALAGLNAALDALRAVQGGPWDDARMDVEAMLAKLGAQND